MNDTPLPMSSEEAATNASLPQKKSPIKRILFITGIIFMVLVVITIFLFVNSGSSFTNTQKNITTIINSNNTSVTPTPFPFEELTIPSMRKNEYKSTLTDINFVEENDEYVSYDAAYTSQGLKIYGLLTKPKGDMPSEGWPAIVFVHGYIPPKSYETFGQAYSSYVDYLARNGFVVFKIDLRGHGNSEGEPGGAYYSADYVNDTLNAYAALEKTDFVNKKAIGLWGHSMAGNVTLRGVAVKTAIPAVVIWGGAGFTYTDIHTYRINDASYDPSQSSTARRGKREEIRKLYGDPDLSKSFWQQMAPTTYLNELKGAIALHHANDDNVVSVNYSKDLNILLDKTKVPHEFYEYVDGGHNISGESFTLAMERTVTFYKKYLQ